MCYTMWSANVYIVENIIPLEAYHVLYGIEAAYVYRVKGGQVFIQYEME